MTPSQNQEGKFRAQIYNPETQKQESLGTTYPTAKAAAHAYNKRAKELGRPLNVIEDDGGGEGEDSKKRKRMDPSKPTAKKPRRLQPVRGSDIVRGTL